MAVGMIATMSECPESDNGEHCYHWEEGYCCLCDVENGNYDPWAEWKPADDE